MVEDYVGLDPYEIHEAIENRILAIASRYARYGRIDLERCVVETDNGEIEIPPQDCVELRILYEIDKKIMGGR